MAGRLPGVQSQTNPNDDSYYRKCPIRSVAPFLVLIDVHRRAAPSTFERHDQANHSPVHVVAHEVVPVAPQGGPTRRRGRADVKFAPTCTRIES